MSKMEARSRVAMKGWRVGAMFVLALMATSGAARAQTPVPNAKPSQPATTDVDARVERLYYDGVAAAKKKQWESARASFEEAFKLDPRPQIALNLGNAELESGRFCDAAEHLQFFLREEKKATPEDRAGIQTLLDKALTKISIIEVTVDTDGAEVFVNDQSRGKTPLSKPICVEPGSYTIEAKHPEREPASQRVAVTAGAKLPLEFKLRVIKRIDGPVVPPVTPEPKWRKPLLYTSIGVGIVGLGLGVGFTAAAASKDTAANDEFQGLRERTLVNNPICPQGVDVTPRCANLYNLMKTRDTFVGVAVTGYVLTGVGAAGAIALSLMRPKRPKDERPVEPKVMVLPTTSGIVVSGSF